MASTTTSASPSGRVRCIITPVDVSLWVSATTSTPSGTASWMAGWVPGSEATMTGDCRCGAAAAASANFWENSPNT